MTISAVGTTNTFSQWLAVTNQIVDFANQVDANGNLIRFVSNTSALTISANSVRGGIVYISTNVAISANDTSTSNLSSAFLANNLNNLILNVSSQSTSSFLQANLAYSKSNTANITADVAFGQANLAYAKANTANVTADIALASISISYDKTNLAYSKANTANITGDAAFGQANIAYSASNVAFANANTTRTWTQSAFSQANLAYANANTGITYSQSAFTQANLAYANANTGITYSQSAYAQANLAYANANTGITYSQNAFAQANLAYANANTGITYSQSAFAKANAANITADAAFGASNVVYAAENVTRTWTNAAFTKANTVGITADLAYANGANAILYPIGSQAVTDSNVVVFNGTTGRLIKDSSKVIPSGSIVGTTDIQTLTNKTLQGARDVKVTLSGTNIDLSQGNYFTKTISGSTTFTTTNNTATGFASSFILELTNGGSQALTFPTGTKWAGGAPPTFTTAGTDVVGFYSHDGGSTWRAILIGLDFK